MSATPQVDVESIVQVAQRAVEAQDLGDGRKAFVLPGDSDSLVLVEPRPDRDLQRPRRVTGATLLRDADSFTALHRKHALHETEVFADPDAFTVTAVLNADQSAGDGELLDGTDVAGHRDHRLVLQLRKTPAWLAWAGLDGKLLEQTVFAEHLEDRLQDVVRPSGADMLELAQTFSATTKVDFKSAVALSSGVRQLQYEETQTAKAGQKGSIEIPRTFDLGVQPFEGGPAYKVVARFRYQIRDGRLQLGYRIQNPEKVLEEAFTDVTTGIGSELDVPVLLGTAPPARS